MNGLPPTTWRSKKRTTKTNDGFDGGGIVTTHSKLILLLLVSVAAMASAVYAQEEDLLEWPRQIDADFGQVIIYQPQVESFSNTILEARAAISVTRAGTSQPVFGAMWFKSRVSTDFDERIVALEDLEVTNAKFPDEDESDVAGLASFLEAEIPQWNIEMDLDRLLTSLDGPADANTQGLNHAPPEIIFVTHPATLVTIDGEPRMGDLEGYDLQYVVNTPYFIVQDPKSKRYYLKGGDHWYESADIMSGWAVIDRLPGSIQDVAKAVEEQEKQQAAEAGEEPDPEAEVGDSPPPEIIVRTHAAEVVETSDDPEFAPIEGTNLLYMQNTESDIVMDITSQSYYVLLSGRWYTSDSMTSDNWTFIEPDALPADFAKIPAESDMGQVRASVAGTEEAKEAVLENQIPQTAEIDRKSATVTVTYDGDPKFEKCADDVAYAVNTDKAVLLIDNKYWCCDDAIWFVSNGPNGPWQVATSVPEQVQDIPPDCPHYNVKYVYVYDSTPDVVYVAYTPAYMGSYVYGGCVVWGTGWWYRPWVGPVYYYPRPVTWGFGCHWNPVTGWGFTFGVSFGWLHISVGRPWYGGWWGPAGYRHGYRHGYWRGYHHGYHRGARAGFRAGYRAGQKQHHRNIYKDRQGVKKTGRPSTQPARGSTQARKQAKKADKPNNHYADKSGNVHRNQNGQWQQKNKSGWSSSSNKNTQQQMKRSQQNRNRGNARAQQNRSTRSHRGGGRRR